MKWWSDLWLNEGFASFMESKGVDAVEKDWNFYDWFPVNRLAAAIDVDSLNSSHPIVKPINEPSQMAYMSAIVYSKVERQLYREYKLDNFNNYFA